MICSGRVILLILLHTAETWLISCGDAIFRFSYSIHFYHYITFTENISNTNLQARHLKFFNLSFGKHYFSHVFLLNRNEL